MHLVAIAWIYVVLMMAVAEALAPNGTLLGALITFVLYGVLPLSLVIYILATPARRRLRRRAEEASTPSHGDGGHHTSGDAVAAERKEP